MALLRKFLQVGSIGSSPSKQLTRMYSKSTLDKSELVRELEAGGLPLKQADAIVSAFAKSVGNSLNVIANYHERKVDLAKIEDRKAVALSKYKSDLLSLQEKHSAEIGSMIAKGYHTMSVLSQRNYAQIDHGFSRLKLQLIHEVAGKFRFGMLRYVLLLLLATSGSVVFLSQRDALGHQIVKMINDLGV